MNPQEIQQYEQYVAIYNDIDEYMRKKLNAKGLMDHMGLIDALAKKDRFFAQHGRDLKNLARLRNVIEHNPYRSKAHPMAVPNLAIIEQYGTLRNNLLKPPLALTIAIPGPQVYTTRCDAKAVDVMAIMDENTYTHVPIMENGKMVGVFSENVILSFLAEGKDSIITRETTIDEFKDFSPLDKHRSENFAFVPRTASIADVLKVFNKAIKAHKRIGLIFITQSGNPQEKFIGILTAWDLASYDGLLS